MPDHPHDLDALIRRLRDLCTEFDAATARAAFEKKAAELGLSPDQRARVEALVFFGQGNQFGDVAIGDIAGRDVLKGDITLSPDARIEGVAVGVNLGAIIYGRAPEEDERRQVARYMERLAARLRRLPLSGLSARLDEGEGVALERVYVDLALTRRAPLAQGTPKTLTKYCAFEQLDAPLLAGVRAPALRVTVREKYDPDRALPLSAVTEVEWLSTGVEPRFRLLRQLLATEAIAQTPCLVLLGNPGSGKSTLLRHVAWALARRGLDQFDKRTVLAGWADDARCLPVLLPLRRLAGRIAHEGPAPATVVAALAAELEREYGVRGAPGLLDAALAGSSALLLFDGLDEVPLEKTPTSAARLTALHAVRAFADLYPQARIVVTCRTRAFSDDLRACLGWPVETLAPFTLGQARHFIAAWFDTLAARGSLAQDQAASHARALVAAITGSERLRQMAETPLLLTMMALVLVERGELPRDRALLYEEVLRQFLGEWDVQRGGQSLAAVLGAPNLRGDDLRPILDRLSFEAHAGATSEDGRGRLSTRDLRYALAEYLATIRVDRAWEAAERCLAYLNERSGLLLPEDEGTCFAFAHLTLQEHGAGRHLLLRPDAVRAVMERRADDRWIEPIALGMGVVQRLYPMLADRVDRILTELIDPDEAGCPKERARWYRDLLLAGQLGQERDWDLLRALINVDRLQRDLRAGLATLLADRDQPLPFAERLRAAELLGVLGDPRFPVTLAQWRAELARRSETFGQPAGYWCYLPAGTYRIGGWDDDKAADVPLAAFWIARYPITVAQFAPFVDAGYGPGAERWWTPQGWRWKRSRKRTKPWRWGESGYNAPNQAVSGVTWYEAAAFCAWLTEQLGDALPAGYEVRLPTEAEWEAAAAWDGRGGRRPYPWGAAGPTPELAIYKASGLGRPAPVGMCPAGAAACGALDLAGNVWEWTASSYEGYPARSGTPVKDFTPGEGDVPVRGGSWWNDSTSVRCGARVRIHPGNFGDISGGLRVCAAPRSHKGSGF